MTDMSDTRQLIQNTLKSAREAAGAKEHVRAIRLFAKCVELVQAESKSGAKNNTLAYYYSCIAFSELALKRFQKVLKAMVQSLHYLDLQSDYGIKTLAWILANRTYVESLMGDKARKQSKLLEQLRIGDAELDKMVRRLMVPGELAPRVDDYFLHGKKIKDPFSFLEVDSDSERSQWLNKEIERSDIALQFLRAKYPVPDDLYKAGWSQLHRLPSRVGRYYIFYESKLYTHHVIVRRSKSLRNKGKVVYDSSKVLKENESPAGCRVSPNGRWLVYGASPNGSDRSYWRIRDLESGADLPGQIDNVLWGNIYFSPDGKGLLYQFSESSEGGLGLRAPTYYRKLGSSRHRIFHKPYGADADRSSANILFGNRFVLFSERVKRSYNQRVYLKPNRRDFAGEPLSLFAGRPGKYKWLGWKNQRVFFLTRHRAPRGRIVMLELSKNGRKVLRDVEVVPQGDDNIIDAYFNQDSIILSTLSKDGKCNSLRVYSHDGEYRGDISLPFDGIVGGVSCAYKTGECFFAITASARPTEIYCHDFKTGKTKLLFGAAFKPTVAVVSRVEQVPSADGTLVPMHISYRADLPKQPAPCLMNVYGGFAHLMVPGFNYQAWCWMTMGGIWVQPYVRGGAELGDNWHLQATKLTKQKTFEDTFCCAQYLVKKGYTTASRLALMGASNGGLTVGAMLTRHPESFAAAIITNGLLDLIKFSEHSNGWSWVSEYGSVKNKEEFFNILSYSPYHRVAPSRKTGTVPTVFFCASESDDRVPAWHSYKFAARLAHEKPDFRSIFSVRRAEGHSSSRPSNTVLNELLFLKFVLAK